MTRHRPPPPGSDRTSLEFWSVYFYHVVYDPAGDPWTIVAVLHGARNVAEILKELG
jgi:plasmid stabilization system protein ParE